LLSLAWSVSVATPEVDSFGSGALCSGLSSPRPGRAGPANIGQLYAVDADGSNLRKLTDGPGSFVQPSWSRDGKRIYAFQHWETEEFGNLAVFEVVAR